MDLFLSLFWEVLCFGIGYWTLRVITFGKVDLCKGSKFDYLVAFLGFLEILLISVSFVFILRA